MWINMARLVISLICLPISIILILSFLGIVELPVSVAKVKTDSGTIVIAQNTAPQQVPYWDPYSGEPPLDPEGNPYEYYRDNDYDNYGDPSSQYQQYYYPNDDNEDAYYRAPPADNDADLDYLMYYQ